MSGHDSVVNTLVVNDDGVLVSGGDNGSIRFWDYETGYCFQKTETVVQPGYYFHQLTFEFTKFFLCIWTIFHFLQGLLTQKLGYLRPNLISLEGNPQQLQQLYSSWQRNIDWYSFRVLSRLITCEADKSIKIWRENADASEDSHPIDMKTWTKNCLAMKRY